MALPIITPFPPIKTQFFTKAGNIAEEWQRFFLSLRTGLNFVITSGTSETGIQTLGAVGLEAIGQPLPDDFIPPAFPTLPTSVGSSVLALLTDSETPEETWPVAVPGSLFIGQSVIAGTVGSVLFIGSAGLAQDNAKFFWKDSQPALGIGTAAPLSNSGWTTFIDITDAGGQGSAVMLHVSGSTSEGGFGATASGMYLDSVGAAVANPNNALYFRTTDVNSSAAGKIRWSIQFDGSLNGGNPNAADDNLYNIGSATAGRPKNVFIGTKLTSPDVTISNMTLGSVLFAKASGAVGQDNARLFWDDSGFKLGLLTASPQRTLDLSTSAGGITFGDDVTATSERGIYWHSGAGASGYAIFRDSGAWSGAFHQLNIVWQTGIVLDPGASSTKSYVQVNQGGINSGPAHTPPGSGLAVAGNVEFLGSAKVSIYQGVTTAGWGVPAIYGLDNRTGLTGADGAAITLYTTVAANNIFRVSADIFATAAVTGTATYSITWTENSTGQTMSVTATAINTLGTQSNLIRPDNGTAIKAQLTGVFTGTFTVVGLVEQVA